MKKLTIAFSIFALLLIPVYFTLLYLNIDYSKNQITYTYKYTNTGISFYKENKLISTYSCENNCIIHRINTINYFKDGKTIIKDGEYLFTYNILKGKIIDEKVKAKNTIYSYVFALNDYLLVIEDNYLKLINYKEETVLNITALEYTSDIQATEKDNILFINTKNNLVKINLENIG